jgi:VanZ family protein
VAYVALVLLATLSRLEFSPDLGAAAERLVRAFSLQLRWSDAVDGLRNLVLFAGFGTVWIVTSTAPRLVPAIRRAALAGFALSALIEALQLFSPERKASVMDVASNGIGGVLGAVGTGLLIAVVRRSRGARSYLGVPMLLVAGAYGAAVLCEAVTPLFRSTPLPGVHGGPLIRLRVMLALATPLELQHIPWLDILLYAPAAFLMVVLLAELGADVRLAAWRVGALGAGLVFLLEPVHGLTGITVRWEAALTHAVAVAAGAWAAGRWLPTLTQRLRGPKRALAFICSYAALLALWGWRPLQLRTDLDAIAAQFQLRALIPMESLVVRADVFSALHAMQQFLLYLPLGSLLAVWPLRRAGPLAQLTPAYALAIVIELGHAFVAGRLFDITNVLLVCGGLVVGWIIIRRSGFAPYGEALSPSPPPP